MKQREKGVTLLEVLLVLAIAMSIIVLSLRQYYSFRRDADLLQIKYNVDTLFQAAAGYYHANCPKGGQLDPEIITDNVKPIDITTDLINAGYLESSFPTPVPLVDSTGPGKDGYIVQFNKYTAPKMQSVCNDPPSCTISTPIQIGTIILWKIQVAVKLQNDSQTVNNLNYLSGDCLSTASGSPATVAFCSTNPTGNYLVFERMPSYATSNSNTQSDLWISTPLLKQYQQMYTTNPMTDLTNQSHATEYQYYYCNG